jgi:uncharacterized FlgJ-related protein
MNIISKYGTDLYLSLVQQGFWPDTAKLITAQAAHETGNFTSAIFKYQNNPWGMKLPAQRRTTATGEARGHAIYNNLADAVTDYWYYWTAQKYPPVYKDVFTFVADLKRHNYFEADEAEYQKGVEAFYKLYFNG